MTAQVPLMITNKMRAELAALGFSAEQIREMTPAQAWEHLGGPPAEQEPPAQDAPWPLEMADDLPEDYPPQPPDDWPDDYQTTAPAPSPATQATSAGPISDTYAAHVLRKVLDGRPVNGHLDRLPGELRDVAEAIDATPPGGNGRALVFEAELSKLADKSRAAAIRAAIHAADPGADLDILLADLPQEYNRFALIWADEALDPQPPVDWIIENLLSAGSVNMIVGPPKSKKTFALLDMAVCVATGAAWLGLSTNQAPVLLIDEESGPQRLKRRLGDTMRGHFADRKTPIAAVSLAGFDLRKPEEAGELHSLILATGARLVVIDALADIMPGGDENAVKDVQPLMLALRKIAYLTGCAIILIHHTNKTGDYRGSTALPGAVDCMIQISSQAGSPNIDFDLVYSRDGEPFKFAATAHWSDGQFWLSESDPKQSTRKLSKSHSYVLRYLAEAGGVATIKDIESHADSCTDKSARQAVYSLSSDGYLKRVDDGGQGSPATYGFTSKTQELLDFMGLEVVKKPAEEESPDDGKL